MLETFANTEPTLVDTEGIRRQLASQGVTSHTPIITIPYELPDLEQVVDLNETYPWAEPHTAIRTTEAYEKRKRRAAGEPVSESNLPTSFWVPLMDVVVVIDDTNLNISDFGLSYARGNTIDVIAHELTHGAFAPLTKLQISESESAVIFNQKYCIGQAEDIKTFQPFSAQERDYEPIWLDEAFAIYMAAQVRSQLFPEGSPTESCRVFEDETEIELSSKYLLKFDDSQSSSPLSTVEGAGIDLLVAKRPDLLPKIKALAAGKLAIAAFHADLRNSVGCQLYGDLVQRRPYESGLSILEQIMELS